MSKAKEPAGETIQEANARRLGDCGALLCHETCGGFAYDHTQDLFRICVCGHTQNVHHFEGDPR